MHKTKIGEAEVLSNGFDAGKYDGTYAATSFDKAWRRRSPSAYERVYPIVYKAAYLLGFHTGFANDEISWPYEEQVIEAERSTERGCVSKTSP